MTATAIVKLADLIADPGALAVVPLEVIPALRGELTRLDTLLLARLLSGSNAHSGNAREGDRRLNAKEAAAKLGTSTDWVYRRSRSLPFVIRLGRKVVFSEAGIEKYIRQRMCR
jgi:predicted DNA-binding transcriptional regulator AlpA